MFASEIIENTFKLVYGEERVVFIKGEDTHLLNIEIPITSDVDDRRYEVITKILVHFVDYFFIDVSTLYKNYGADKIVYSLSFVPTTWSALDMVELVTYLMIVISEEITMNEAKLTQTRQQLEFQTNVKTEFDTLWSFLVNTVMDDV